MKNKQRVVLIGGLSGIWIISLILCFVVGIFVGASSEFTTAFNRQAQTTGSIATFSPTVLPTSADTLSSTLIGTMSPSPGGTLPPNAVNSPEPTTLSTLAALPVPTNTSGPASRTPPLPLPTPRPNPVTPVPAPISTVRTTQPHSIGWIGCSNTEMSAQGYLTVGGNAAFLWTPYDTAGAVIEVWGDPTQSGYAVAWNRFDSQVAMDGQPAAVWIEICEKNVPSRYSTVQRAIAALRQHTTSGTVFYISGLNQYDPANLCPAQWQDSETNAQRAVSDGLALAGPVMGPLTANNTEADHCHPNAAGQALLGNQLHSFFDH
jgi:hypothetical protein